MSSCVINEQEICDEIFSNYMEISTSYEEEENDDYNKKREKEKDKRNALSIWKAELFMKLMGLLENEVNRSIVTHAITFILSLGRDEKLRGINTSHLNNSTRKEFRIILQSELSGNLPN